MGIKVAIRRQSGGNQVGIKVAIRLYSDARSPLMQQERTPSPGCRAPSAIRGPMEQLGLHWQGIAEASSSACRWRSGGNQWRSRGDQVAIRWRSGLQGHRGRRRRGGRRWLRRRGERRRRCGARSRRSGRNSASGGSAGFRLEGGCNSCGILRQLRPTIRMVGLPQLGLLVAAAGGGASGPLALHIRQLLAAGHVLPTMAVRRGDGAPLARRDLHIRQLRNSAARRRPGRRGVAYYGAAGCWGGGLA